MSDRAAHAQEVREATALQGESAGIVTRAAAAVSDGLVILVVLVAFWAGWSAVQFLTDPVRFTLPSPPWSLVITAGALVGFIYFTLMWATSGRTYGAQLLGLRVVADDRRPLHWARSAVRAALCVLFPAGLLWTVVSARNRSVQDLLLRTTVVYDWRPQVGRVPRGPHIDPGPRRG